MAGMILVGGMSRRMGKQKAMLQLGGSTILERVISSLSRVYPQDRIYLVTPRPAEVAWLGLGVIESEQYSVGPLAGLAEALKHSPDEHNVVVGCDMPFISSELLALFLAKLPGNLAVVPEVGGYLEPLCAAYSKQAVNLLAQELHSGQFGLQKAVRMLNPLILPEENIRLYDPFLRSFFNINTWDDFERARSLLAKL